HMLTEAKSSNLAEIDQEDEALDSVSGNNLVEVDENDEAFDSEICHIYKQKVAAIRCIANHLEQELTANNFNHITQVVNNMNRLFMMLNDIEAAQN
ncbi:222_t:CDS:2, partial [Racocetra fulgida]